MGLCSPNCLLASKRKIGALFQNNARGWCCSHSGLVEWDGSCVVQASNAPLKGNSIGDLVWYKGLFRLMNYARGSLILITISCSPLSMAGQDECSFVWLQTRPQPKGAASPSLLPCPASPHHHPVHWVHKYFREHRMKWLWCQFGAFHGQQNHHKI